MCVCAVGGARPQGVWLEAGGRGAARGRCARGRRGRSGREAPAVLGHPAVDLLARGLERALASGVVLGQLKGGQRRGNDGRLRRRRHQGGEGAGRWPCRGRSLGAQVRASPPCSCRLPLDTPTRAPARRNAYRLLLVLLWAGAKQARIRGARHDGARHGGQSGQGDGTPGHGRLGGRLLLRPHGHCASLRLWGLGAAGGTATERVAATRVKPKRSLQPMGLRSARPGRARHPPQAAGLDGGSRHGGGVWGNRPCRKY